MPSAPPPLPSPTPLLVEIAGSGEAAPWWGVPAIAGAFLIIGGFLTYLYARHTEKTKADRSQQEKWAEDVLNTGLAMLSAGERIRKLGLLSLRRDAAENMKMAAEQAMPLLDEISIAARRFNVTMPQEFQDDFNGYLMWSLVIMTPPFQRPGQELKLNNQVKFERAIVTRLRATRNLTPLIFPDAASFGGIHPEAMLADAVASDLRAEREAREARERNDGQGSDEGFSSGRPHVS
ncbi:hypothetical protein ACWPKO_29995 (plasmid) [Coraliomargarita sp. W4R53]